MRVPQWQSRLLEWGDDQRYRKFAWGESDCASLVVEGLALVFGHPVMQVEYASREEAKATMRDLVKNAGEFLQAHGARCTPLNQLQGGDVVVKPRLVNRMPQLALALDHEVLLQSTPHTGPVWIGREELSRDSLAYRFD